MSQAGRYADDSFLPDIESLTGDIGAAVHPHPASFNIDLIGGTGLTTTGTPGSYQITFDVVGGGVKWYRVAGTTQAADINTGYIPTNVALTTVTLPATAAVGSIIEICGEGAGGWTIAQNAGQQIQFGSAATTLGVAGSIDSKNQYDCVKIVCRVADTTWSVLSVVGTLKVN